MTLDRLVVKEIPFQRRMTKELAETWAYEIPQFSENDPNDPEWPATPVYLLDLTSEGLGVVHVKDESVNPTGTHKDRPAWEMAVEYRNYARGLLTQNIDISSVIVPRLTVLTSGNEGRALAERFAIHDLPPVKILLSSKISPKRLETLKDLDCADIYQVDAQDELTPDDIKNATNNENGIELTSVMLIKPNEIFYDWLVHRALNEGSSEIYLPYGSGKLMENFLTWQWINSQQFLSYGKADPRLEIPYQKLVSTSILGAEPEKSNSDADKLTAPCKPFRILRKNDFNAGKILRSTGMDTGVYKIREDSISEADRLFQKHGIAAEPSGAAGLALYIQRVDRKEINPNDGKKRLIINTGKGI